MDVAAGCRRGYEVILVMQIDRSVCLFTPFPDSIMSLVEYTLFDIMWFSDAYFTLLPQINYRGSTEILCQ